MFMMMRANRIAETVELVDFSVSAMSFQSQSCFKGSAHEMNLLLFVQLATVTSNFWDDNFVPEVDITNVITS